MTIVVKVYDMFEESDIDNAERIINECNCIIEDIDVDDKENTAIFYVNLGGLSELSEFKKKMYASGLRLVA